MFGTDDMTFCTADCAMKDKCYRNPALIKEQQYPHSFADFSKNCMVYEPKDIAKAIVHKMIDDAAIAEDAYPDLRQKMHDAVDEYEPQTEREGE